MTSSGRQAAIGLIATLLAGTAGCAASPQYPIERGQAAGDGGLHMTAHPQYPIGNGQNASARAYDANPDQNRAAPAARAPAPSDDDDMPRAVPSAPVYSAPQARADGQPHLDFGLAEVPPAFEQAAYHHHHAAPADESDTPAPLTRKERAKAKAEKAEAEKAEKADAKSGRSHGKTAEVADAAPADDKAASGDMPLAVTLKPGERLATVAKRLHISKQALMQVNGISPDDKVLPGSTLKTPYRYAYEIKKGDTLYAIGHRFHMDTDDLAKLNALKHAGALQPGQTVELPASVADTGARDHAHGDGLVPVGAPDKLIATMTRQERRAADREAAKEARLERRHPHHEVETAEAAPTPEPAPTRASRRRRFTPPPTDLTSSNVPSAVAQAAPEPYRPAPAPAYVAPTPEPTPAPYVPPAQTASRPTYGAPAIVPARPPVSVANEMAADTHASTPSASAAASTQARQTVSSSDTGLTTARPSPAYAAATPYRAPTTSYGATTTPSTTRPIGSGYAASTTSGYAASTYAARPPAATATPGYPSATYAAPSAASAPARVASLNTPTYGSPYGAPSLGRPRPTLSTSTGGASNAEVAAAGHGRFVWPLRGAILEPFGDKGPGQRNDGLDIVAQPGESVHAAASGEVVYAGSSIPGFGNLILVKHTGGWVTAYAHLDRIEVRMRDSVTQGQEIGQAGQTGAVDRPQLHFEVRYAPQADEKARPVDPTLVLPGAG
ncbi:MAG: peptidoglycan DD-metalloendopeptidase family protein [Caulobacteraceae bacterium]